MYVVVRITNFDSDRIAKILPDMETAQKWLRKDWEDFYNDWIANPDIFEDEELTYYEGDYAILSADDGDRVEWFLIECEE